VLVRRARISNTKRFTPVFTLCAPPAASTTHPYTRHTLPRHHLLGVFSARPWFSRPATTFTLLPHSAGIRALRQQLDCTFHTRYRETNYEQLIPDCLGHGLRRRSRKGQDGDGEQKWDYINLSDFKSSSCLAPLSYVWLWILVFVSCAVYAADAFTAVNLLAFNKWSSQVKPKVPFEVAKWIFAITIIISYVFLLYRWIMALRVMKTGSVVECYLDPLAAILQSMRITSSGQGWRRFLVFAELTKSKKGANYIALFVYFQFKSALLIIVAQGPRIAINAMTLYAVMQAQLLPVGHHASEDRSGFEQFFFNIKLLVEDGNQRETIIYFTMLFSLLIWVIAALGLIISALLYLFFLWHYIPRTDGSLTAYCRRKLETRLGRIVGKKIKKAIEKQDQQRRRDEQRAIKKGALDLSRTA